MLRMPVMSRVLVIRPGATPFDDEQRIKGSLDMPMSDRGRVQVDIMAAELADFRLKTIFVAPCESARETAERLAKGRDVRIKVIDAFKNIDHGLWHGKLIEEMRKNQPRVYRTGQESPDDLCPPGGESIRDARLRVLKSVRKVAKKSRDEVVAIVAPEPIASIIQSALQREPMCSLWESETDTGKWDLVESELW
ncbi:histidine phosphatase family protein [Novipirellula artificiosorum]|uniref:Phosphoserine phosphatase 1 n=1 Tax=Novipirellula artificiosorum TaxID=2528016 RepID=A0A5C6DTI1_9BACT|nr:histidine phosphatase family protein [Novipirellula artificiosorum]TWU39187.1 Phosphoserine phosphatase 1 [Novipirellula artificiosorum]